MDIGHATISKCAFPLDYNTTRSIEFFVVDMADCGGDWLGLYDVKTFQYLTTIGNTLYDCDNLRMEELFGIFIEECKERALKYHVYYYEDLDEDPIVKEYWSLLQKTREAEKYKLVSTDEYNKLLSICKSV